MDDVFLVTSGRPCEVVDPVGGRTISLSKMNLPDAVVGRSRLTL